MLKRGRVLGWHARNRMVAISHITSNCSRASNSRDANQQQLGYYNSIHSKDNSSSKDTIAAARMQPKAGTPAKAGTPLTARTLVAVGPPYAR